MAIASVPNVVIGGATKAGDHNALVTAVNALIDATCPIGGIIAWHKTLTGVPALSDRFAECSGGVINDADSPMNGETLPDLNGDARFLRGAATSGTEQADAFQGHHHEIRRNTDYYYAFENARYDVTGAGGSIETTPTKEAARMSARDVDADGTNGTPRIATETRPINMTVVWIMRIK